jgi:hypothetical protein
VIQALRTSHRSDTLGQPAGPSTSQCANIGESSPGIEGEILPSSKDGSLRPYVRTLVMICALTKNIASIRRSAVMAFMFLAFQPTICGVSLLVPAAAYLRYTIMANYSPSVRESRAVFPS